MSYYPSNNMKIPVRKDIKKFSDYFSSQDIKQLSKKSGVPISRLIKANTGENPVHEALLPKTLTIDLFRYPDPYCSVLRTKLANYTKYPVTNIICTNGSDEALDLLCRLFIEPDDEVIICPPTYPYFEFYTALSRGKVIKVMRDNNLQIDIDNVVAKINKKTKLIFLDSPGNPTGTTISKEGLEKILKKNVIVIVDEAYFEYSKESVISLVKTHKNLVITRTFSKWAGLAGLRIGYVVAADEIINGLLQIRLPYSVNSVSQFYASYILDNKSTFLKRLNSYINLRDLAIQRLSEFAGITVFPSKSTYVVIKLNTKKNALELKKALDKEGIFVKSLDEPLLENSFRINFGTSEELNRFCSVLERMCK